MRNTISQVQAQDGSKTVDLTVFHGSPHLFEEFEFHQKPNTKMIPGIWFAADEGYCRSHGHYIYECKIERAIAHWVEDGDILTIDEANAIGADCQIFICAPVDDAIITVNNLSVVEIVRIFDPTVGQYLGVEQVAEMLKGESLLLDRPPHTPLPAF